MKRMKVCAFVLVAFGLCLGGSAEQCGRQAGGAVCPNGLCCSQYGYCGTTDAYCNFGCQSQCWPHPPPPPTPLPPPPPLPPAPPGQKDVTDIISPELFDQLLLHRNDPVCEGKGFYSYYAFVTAARSFDGFLTYGNDTIRKRELAAFLGQTSHETTGGWDGAPDGRYAWGYCFINEQGGGGNYYCQQYNPPKWSCAPGKKYYGRGPIQLSWNYNYGQAGDYLGIDLLRDPDLVATDAVISFKTAIWFWMTRQGNKPSSHSVITDNWHPSSADIAAGRLPGYGVITNIINGGLECGFGPDDRVKSRIGFYKRYCDILGIDYGDNLDCYAQRPFGSGLKLSYDQM